MSKNGTYNGQKVFFWILKTLKQINNNAPNLPLGPEEHGHHFVVADRSHRPPQSVEHVHYTEHRAGNSMNQDSSGYEHSTRSPASMFKLIRMRIIPATTSRVGPTARKKEKNGSGGGQFKIV